MRLLGRWHRPTPWRVPCFLVSRYRNSQVHVQADASTRFDESPGTFKLARANPQIRDWARLISWVVGFLLFVTHLILQLHIGLDFGKGRVVSILSGTCNGRLSLLPPIYSENLYNIHYCIRSGLARHSSPKLINRAGFYLHHWPGIMYHSFAIPATLEDARIRDDHASAFSLHCPVNYFQEAAELYQSFHFRPKQISIQEQGLESALLLVRGHVRVWVGSCLTHDRRVQECGEVCSESHVLGHRLYRIHAGLGLRLYWNGMLPKILDVITFKY